MLENQMNNLQWLTVDNYSSGNHKKDDKVSADLKRKSTSRTKSKQQA